VELVERKAEVRWLYAHFLVSQRRICELLNVAESSQRYVGRQNDEELRERLVAAAREKPKWGYRRLQVKLAAGGMLVNHKRVYRVYREAGLLIRRRRRKRLLRTGITRPMVTGANQEWALDFVHDAAASGRKFRVLSVLDVYTRECLVLEVDTSFASRRVTRELEKVVAERGAPEALRCDNGPEFTSGHFLAWALERKIAVVHIEPGRPVQNAHVESFHGKLRDECLNASWFGNLFEARRKIAAWQEEYNEERPHSSLGYRTPEAFAASCRAMQSCGKDARPNRGLGNPAEDAGFPLSPNSNSNKIVPEEMLTRSNVV
jgi:putative transposase